jgi:hypothetical protein
MQTVWRQKLGKIQVQKSLLTRRWVVVLERRIFGQIKKALGAKFRSRRQRGKIILLSFQMLFLVFLF